MRALSISFGLGKGIRRVRVLRTISAGNLLSQVGLARNLASRVAMLLQSDKNQAEIRPPLGRRAVHRSKWGGGGGGAGEREKKTSGTGQLSNKPDCKRVQTRGGRTHFRDLSRYSSASTLHTFMQISNARVYPRRVGMQKFTRSAEVRRVCSARRSSCVVSGKGRPPKKEGKEIRISLTSSSARARVRQTNWLRFAPSWLSTFSYRRDETLVSRASRPFKI